MTTTRALGLNSPTGSSTAATATMSNRTRRQPQKKKSLLDWYSGAAELFSDKLTCCTSANYQTQVVLHDEQEDYIQEWNADDSSIVDTSTTSAVPIFSSSSSSSNPFRSLLSSSSSFSGLRQGLVVRGGSAGNSSTKGHHPTNTNANNNSTMSVLQEDAAHWQQSLKRQSYDCDNEPSSSSQQQRRRRQRTASGPATMLLLPCSSCLPSSCASTEFVGDFDLKKKGPSKAGGENRDSPSTMSKNGSSKQDLSVRRGDHLQKGTTYFSSPSSAFDMPMVPLRSVPSFGTATTTSMTTCKSSNCAVEWQEQHHASYPSAPPLPSSIPMMRALQDDDDDDDEDDHEEWDANSTTTTEIVSHCQNPFRRKEEENDDFSQQQQQQQQQQQPCEDDSPEAYRFLKRMSPRHYVHSDAEDENVDEGDDDFYNPHDHRRIMTTNTLMGEEYQQDELEDSERAVCSDASQILYPSRGAVARTGDGAARSVLQFHDNCYNNYNYQEEEDELWYQEQQQRAETTSKSLRRVQQSSLAHLPHLSQSHGFSC